MDNSCHNHNKCIETALETAEKLCLKKNLFFTPIRKNIFKLIWQSHCPLKAYDILEQLQKEEPSAKPITIYRTLDFLLENRLIHKIECQNTYFGCSHPGDLHNCYFTICDKCNSVNEECKSQFLKNIHSGLKDDGFQIKHVTLEIQGTCSKCLISL